MSGPRILPTATPRVAFRGIAAALSVWVLAAHAATLCFRRYANVDEGYASALASRLLDGRHLYDGAVSQRGPLFYYAYACLAGAFGWDNILAIRVVALLWTFVAIAALGWSGNKLAGPWAGMVAAAALSYGLVFGVPPYEGLAFHAELLALPFIVVAIAVGAAAFRDPLRPYVFRALFASGVGIGFAGCIKQTFLAQAAILFVAVLLVARQRRVPFLQWARALGCALGGFALVPLVVVAHAAAEGTLKRLIYFGFTYNATIHTHPNDGKRLAPIVYHLLDAPLFLALLVGLATSLLIIHRRSLLRPGRVAFQLGLTDYLAAHLFIALAVVASAPQLFPHYFYLPLVCAALWLAVLVAGRIATPAAEQLAGRVTLLAVVLYMFPAVMLGVDRFTFDGEVAHDPRLVEVSARVASKTAPNDRIYVWGFAPWIYGYSQRKPASRFAFSTYMTGFVPWFWDALPREAARVVPGSMGELLQDLAREQPALIVDAGMVQIGRPLRAYPEIRAFVHDGYCFDERIGPYDLYRRKNAGEICHCAPQPGPLLDYFGHPLDVMVSWPPPDEACAP